VDSLPDGEQPAVIHQAQNIWLK